jgi:UDP-glucuronate 4-epimerase
MEYIRALESALGKKAKLDLMPMQDGDVPATEADVSALQADFDYRPRTTINEGIARFVGWYRSYYDE